MFTKGPGPKLAMIEKIDFFRDQIRQCRSQAESAANKADREFWLRLAQRWEWLLQQTDGAKLESVRPLRTGQSVLQRRFAKRRAA
jgi:hypothetical protein